MPSYKRVQDLPKQTRKFVNHLVKRRVYVSIISTRIAGKYGVTATVKPIKKRIWLYLDYKRSKIREGYIIACLAHEYGHILNFQKRSRHYLTVDDTIKHNDYRYSEMSDIGKRKLYREERTAWERGETTLRRYGWKDWSSFEA